jgi:outer membrane protein assembly factor BamB
MFGVVYVGALDDNVYALSAATGANLWSFAAGSLVESSPAMANGVVYTASTDDNVYAFDLAGAPRPSTGRPRGQLRPNYALRPPARPASNPSALR